jgi:hypothetical protein
MKKGTQFLPFPIPDTVLEYAEIIIDGQQTLVENQNDAKKTDDYRALV